MDSKKEPTKRNRNSDHFDLPSRIIVSEPKPDMFIRVVPAGESAPRRDISDQSQRENPSTWKPRARLVTSAANNRFSAPAKKKVTTCLEHLFWPLLRVPFCRATSRLGIKRRSLRLKFHTFMREKHSQKNFLTGSSRP